MRHLGGHLGLSEALLEPSWAILDVPTRRETPRPGQWGGVRGGVNPSPKGKKEAEARREEEVCAAASGRLEAAAFTGAGVPG